MDVSSRFDVAGYGAILASLPLIAFAREEVRGKFAEFVAWVVERARGA